MFLNSLPEKGENRDHADRCRGKKLLSKRFHVGQNFKILIERQKHYSDLTVLSIIVKDVKGRINSKITQPENVKKSKIFPMKTGSVTTCACAPIIKVSCIPIGYGFAPRQRRCIFTLDGALIWPNVCGLAVAGRIRWFHRHIPGCRDMSWLSSTSGSPRHCCIWGKGLWVVWCNSGEVMLRLRGREILIDMIGRLG